MSLFSLFLLNCQFEKSKKVTNKKAIKILNSLQQHDFSQGVVVRNKKLVSIEGGGGTEKMLKKSGSKKFRNQGVLVKFPKKKQDLRVDLPTIGLRTVKFIKKYSLEGLAYSSNKTIILNKPQVINYCEKNKIFFTWRI